MSQRSLITVLFLLLITSSFAQEEPDAQAVSARVQSLALALEQWRSEHGEDWRVRGDAHTGFAELLFGGHVRAASTPRGEADAALAARQFVRQTAALHGIDERTLVTERALFLPLGQVGSGDKWTVRFLQQLDGVAVERAFVNVLLDARGELLSVHSTAQPRLFGLATRPTLDAADALAQARERFASDFGAAVTRVREPALVIERVTQAKSRRALLAWRVALYADVADALPEGRTYWIDARDGSLLRSAPNVHTCDVGGQVSSLATPGVLPDSATNPPTPLPAAHIKVSSSIGDVTTDASGNFNYPGVVTPLDVTVRFAGSFNKVTNAAGANYSLTQTLTPGVVNTVVMNSLVLDTVTAQANAFNGINALRDWVRAVNPADSTADFVKAANVNLAQTCNAYYDGVSLNFFAAGGGCVNTAYSTVVSHENGHWMNDKYGTFNGGDGMGEGNADVFAMYVWNVPEVGADFGGPGNGIRTGTNTVPYCGDGNISCYGEVHADGQPWMGAAWKIRKRLDAAYGNALGDAIADSLFLAWMNGYDQMYIDSIIESQWLTLDDDDGTLSNGTPHYHEIDKGFRDQGFPGFDPPLVKITNVTQLTDTTDEFGPYSLDATVLPLVAPPIVSVFINYRSGVAWQTTLMSPAGVNNWTGAIPGQISPARVQYYVTARDAAGNLVNFPATAPQKPLDFEVGVQRVLFADDFESAGDNGWTHTSLPGAYNNNDDWQHGTPAGLSGNSFGVTWHDPAATPSGTRCWGNDLGLPGFNGAYQSDVRSRLLSPTINCSGVFGTKLRFMRWLTVEEAIYDQARVKVNGHTLAINAPLGNTLDTGWSEVELDIAPYADNNPAVSIEFELHSDGGLELGGWTLDDVTVSHLTATCPTPWNYCQTAVNSVGAGATISYSGSTSLTANDFVLVAKDLPPFENGIFFYGKVPSQALFGNGFRCIAGSLHSLPVNTSDGNGETHFAVDLFNLPPNGLIHHGENWNFQLLYRNPSAAGALFNLSDGLAVTFCP